MKSALVGKSALDWLAASLGTLLGLGLEWLFGPGVDTSIVGGLTWAELGVSLGVMAAVLLMNGLAAA